MQPFAQPTCSLSHYKGAALFLLICLTPILQQSFCHGQGAVPNRRLSGKGESPSGINRALLAAELPSATWVRLRADGSFTARIFELSDSAAYRLQTSGSAVLIDLQGKLQVQYPDKDGQIKFRNLQPGIYSITYYHLGLYLRSVIHLVDGTQDDERRLKSSIDLWCASYSRREVDAMLVPYFVKKSNAAAFGIDRIKVPQVLEQRKLRDAGQLSIQDAQHIPTVQMNDNVLDGVAYRPGTSSDPDRVFDPLENAIILLINGDTVLSSGKTDENGYFSIDSVLPGKYALLLESKEGRGAIGIFVASTNKKVSQVDAHSEQFVSRIASGGGLGIQASPNLPGAQAPVGSSFAGSSMMSPATGSGFGIAPSSVVPSVLEATAESLAEIAEGDSAAPNLQPREASTATPPQ